MAADGSLTYYRSVFTYAKTVGSQIEELQYVLHPEGIIQKESGAWTYKYFKKDHIGSTRVLLAARGGNLVEEQRTDYYPYGLSHGSLNNLQLNRYLYGGKEYQDAMINGSPLGLYDFHARFYNPVLGRWFNQDPAFQTSNPYLYCGNNPIMYTDPDGEWILAVAAIVGAYLGGSAANQDFNLFKWDYSSMATWAGIFGGAIQGVTSVAGIQAGFGQFSWGQGIAQFGRSAATKTLLNGTIVTSGMSNGLAKIGAGIGKGLIVANAAMKGLNTVATISSMCVNSENAGRILMGNYYYNPRRTFLGQIWEGFSRGTYEGIQQSLGSSIGQLRNTFGRVDNVEFYYGATLVNYKNPDKIGDHIFL